MRPETIASRQRLYLLARVVIARHYRRELTLALVARRLGSSPRQLQRAYEQFGETTFTRGSARAADVGRGGAARASSARSRVEDVARLVGYRQGPHFAHAFRRRYGLSPARFRAAALEAAAREVAARRATALEAAARESTVRRATALQAGERP